MAEPKLPAEGLVGSAQREPASVQIHPLWEDLSRPQITMTWRARSIPPPGDFDLPCMVAMLNFLAPLPVNAWHRLLERDQRTVHHCQHLVLPSGIALQCSRLQQLASNSFCGAPE